MSVDIQLVVTFVLHFCVYQRSVHFQYYQALCLALLAFISGLRQQEFPQSLLDLETHTLSSPLPRTKK